MPAGWRLPGVSLLFPSGRDREDTEELLQTQASTASPCEGPGHSAPTCFLLEGAQFTRQSWVASQTVAELQLLQVPRTLRSFLSKCLGQCLLP